MNATVPNSAIPFDEGRLSPHVDPLHDPCSDFDWDELARALGEVETNEDREALGAALGAVLRWAAQPLADTVQLGRASSRAERTVGRTMLVLAWSLNPEQFRGLSLEALADTLGINLRHLRELRSEITKRFGQLRPM